MNTHGHHGIADDAGYPVLDSAFRDLKKRHPLLKFEPKTLRLDAFYLGNWLTDVSQAYDPVAISGVRKLCIDKLSAATHWLDEALATLKKDTVGRAAAASEDASVFIAWITFRSPEEAYHSAQRARRSVLEWSEPYERQVRAAYTNQLNELKAQVEFITKGDKIKRVAKSVFKVIGYFKFVHPAEDVNDRDTIKGGRIDYTSYKEIIEAHYTQYYPHEHLDRPSSNEKATDSATGLYSYMLEHIRATAGILARIDVEWASRVFNGKQEIKDGEETFNLSLARLGHALHLTEDFFAHSNFVEHALASLGPDHMNWRTIPVEQRGIFNKRLQSGPDTPEGYVVTGTFDKVDTFHSLLRAFEEMLATKEFLGPVATVAKAQDGIGGRAQDAADAADDALNALAQGLATATDKDKREEAIKTALTQTFELFDNPEVALQDRRNAVAQKVGKPLKQRFDRIKGHKVDPRLSRDLAQDLFRELGLERTAPAEIQELFVETVDLMMQVITIGQTTITLYKAIKNLLELAEAYKKGPRAVARWLLEKAGLKLVEEIEMLLAYYVKREIYDALGANRYGSHSLISKDYGTDEEEHRVDAGARYAGACARAVHWEIATAMTRHAYPQKFYVSRRAMDLGAGTSKSQNRIVLGTWIDWEDLLLFYLRHPAAATGSSKTGWTETDHVTRAGDTLASIAAQYRATAVSPSSFDWSTIREANNLRLNADTPLPVGMRILVPGQSALVPDAQASPHVWWRPILEQKHSSSLTREGWNAITRRAGWQNDAARSTEHVIYHVPKYVTKGDVVSFHKRQERERERLENAYR